MSILIIKSPLKMQRLAESFRRDGNIIGLVPTMGALHAGHLKLVEIAVKKADIVIVSIFVNPAQFGPQDDFDKYPRSFKSDCDKLEKAGATIVFHPSADNMYPRNFSSFIEVGRIGEILEGQRRPGHFRGVATICAKLFNITHPHFAVFGQKDGQQLAVIRHMTRDLNFDLQIVRGPIVRNRDGAALSSRHAYLTAGQLKKARVINQSLKLAAQLIRNGVRSAHILKNRMRRLIESEPGLTTDYIAFNRWDDLEPLQTLSGEVMISLVVKAGKVRLLDNIIIKTPNLRK